MDPEYDEYEVTDEDHAEPTREKPYVALLMLLGGAFLYVLAFIGILAYADAAAKMGETYLVHHGVTSGMVRLCMLVAPLLGWMYLSIVLVRRLPWWAHFSIQAYAWPRNVLCGGLAAVFTLAASLTTVQVLWS